MSAIRRALMASQRGGNPWEQYIQDGLVFQLDCDSQCSADNWTDLIGGVEYTSNGNVVLDNGVPYFPENACYFGDVLDFHYGTHTIEACFKNVDIKTEAIFDCGIDKTIRLFLSNNYIYYLSSDSDYRKQGYARNNESMFKTLSVNENLCVQNKVNYKKSIDVDYWKTNSEGVSCIGFYDARATNYDFKGHLYSIRIYNRLLTEGEMLKNQLVDLQRFQDR